MNEPLTISDEAREAMTKAKYAAHDGLAAEYVQLAINAAVEKATSELKKETVNQSFVIGELGEQLTQLRKVADGLANKYHEEMMMFFGHASDCPCDRCTFYHAYTNFINQQKEEK